MILRIFTIYDSAAKAHRTPFFLPEIGQALREFKRGANDPQHEWCIHSQDYTLFEIGQFDTDNAIIETYATPENHGLAAKYKVSSPNLQAVNND